ncbi:MAG: ATP synthase subunit C [marine bacterium B5-7]|nr:MAG: ATP synthase subunit C [marine bacterium B5-7]
MKASHYIGWDIGGAHLKVASVCASGEVDMVEQFATPLWHGMELLENEFPRAIEKMPDGALSHALTMTAELVDIFKDRELGMKALINLCETTLGRDISLYATDGEILNLPNAYKRINQLASANWHASATYVASLVDTGLFVDVGSTTTDVIPFSNKTATNRGLDDQARLRFNELVYTGVIRTPLMTLTKQVPFAGEWQNLAAEYFSNTADVYRVLGAIEEGDDLMDTADGGEKDIASSIRRLARMLGTDANDSKISDACWHDLAQYFEEVQIQTLTRSILRVLTNVDIKKQKIVGAGVGCFLVKKIAGRLNIPYIEFSELCTSDPELSPMCNTCAPAVALAQLNRHSVVR